MNLLAWNRCVCCNRCYTGSIFQYPRVNCASLSLDGKSDQNNPTGRQVLKQLSKRQKLRAIIYIYTKSNTSISLNKFKRTSSRTSVSPSGRCDSSESTLKTHRLVFVACKTSARRSCPVFFRPSFFSAMGRRGLRRSWIIRPATLTSDCFTRSGTERMLG